MQWRDLVRPVKAGTVAVARAAVRRATPSPPSTPAAYVSPLQAEVSAIVELKRRVCSLHCVGCTYSAGAVCSFDQRLAKASAEREDPAPYLKDLQSKLDRAVQSNTDLAKKLEESKKWQQPITRLRLGIYTAMGTGMVTAAITVAKLMLGI